MRFFFIYILSERIEVRSGFANTGLPVGSSAFFSSKVILKLYFFGLWQYNKWPIVITPSQLFSLHGLENVFTIFKNNKYSVAEPEPHLLAGAGSGAVTRCGSGGFGSVNGIKHG
jgi:hypothetical protein